MDATCLEAAGTRQTTQPSPAVAAHGNRGDDGKDSATVDRPGGPAGVAVTAPAGLRRSSDDKVNKLTSIPFVVVHLLPMLVLVTGVSWKSVGLLVFTYCTRMFFITAGYHRYFSHRTYRLARLPQFLLAFGGTTAVQKGPLWWASHHRDHHRFADTESDVHSPQKGFWWSHVGWILCDKYAHTKTERIKDFAAYPELRFLDKYDWIGPWALGITCYAIDGWRGAIIGFFTSTVLLWHSTFFINSLAHVLGRRRYATADTSRNSMLLAVLTMGEGWHNNHHYYASSCRNGFFWWEWDPTYYLLKGLSAVGVVKDMKLPPKHALDANRVRHGNFDIGMFRLSWNRAAKTLHGAAASLARERTDEQVPAYGGRAPVDEVEHASGNDGGLQQHVRDVQHFVQSSLDSAEELAQASRRANRTAAVSAR